MVLGPKRFGELLRKYLKILGTSRGPMRVIPFKEQTHASTASYPQQLSNDLAPPVGIPVLATTVLKGYTIRTGQYYRIRNVGAPGSPSVNVSATGFTTVSVGAGNSADIVITTANELGLQVASGATSVIIEPVYDTLEIGQIRSLMAYVLKATDGQTRRLIGTFIGRDGRELLTGNGLAFVSMTPNQTAQPLGNLLLTRVSPDTGDRIWADSYEFRGVLHGGPVEVLPGSPDATIAGASAGFTPPTGTSQIYPGPVILGGSTTVWQPSTGPGFTGPPVAPSASTTITVGTPGTAFIDSSSSPVTPLALRWAPSSSAAGSLRVQAFRRFAALDGTTWVSTIADVDETFPTATTASQTVHVELGQGLWDVTFTATGVSATLFQWMVQRIQ